MLRTCKIFCEGKFSKGRVADRSGIIPLSIRVRRNVRALVRVYYPQGRRRVLFAHTDCSYLCGDLWVALGNRCNVFPERFPPSCAGGKNLCRIHAHHGRPRCIPSNREASTEQHRRWDSNRLSHRNRMADRQAQRRGNQSFRLGCAPDSFDARYPHLDEWSESRA